MLLFGESLPTRLHNVQATLVTAHLSRAALGTRKSCKGIFKNERRTNHSREIIGEGAGRKRPARPRGNLHRQSRLSLRHRAPTRTTAAQQNRNNKSEIISLLHLNYPTMVEICQAACSRFVHDSCSGFRVQRFGSRISCSGFRVQYWSGLWPCRQFVRQTWSR